MDKSNERKSKLKTALVVGALGLGVLNAFLNPNILGREFKSSIYDLQAPVGVVDVQEIQVDSDLYTLGAKGFENFIEKSKMTISEDGEISVGISKEVGQEYRESFERVCVFLNELFEVVNPNYRVKIVDGVSESNEANIYHKELEKNENVLMSTLTTYQNYMDNNGNIVDSERLANTAGIYIQNYCDDFKKTNQLMVDYVFLHEMGHVFGLSDFNNKVNSHCSIMNYTNFGQVVRNVDRLGIFKGDLVAFYELFGAKNEQEFSEMNSQFSSFEDYMNAVNSYGEETCLGEFPNPESVQEK